MRFLVDRRVVQDHEVQKVCPQATRFEESFATVENIAATSRWLDQTFNGDLLPLTSAVNTGALPWFSRFSGAARQRIFTTLSTIMYRTETTGQMVMNWGDLDFAHVPVGLLASVERLAKITRKRRATRCTTPPRGSRIQVDEAFTRSRQPRAPASSAPVRACLVLRSVAGRSGRRHEGKATTRVLGNLIGIAVGQDQRSLSALSLYSPRR